MAVIVAIGGIDAELAAKEATASIPIVFAVAADPVSTGLVASMNRPGGNVTGVTFFNTALSSKRLGLSHELVPQATTIAYLSSNIRRRPAASTPEVSDDQMLEILAAGRALGLEIVVGEVADDRDFDAVFSTFAARRASALVVRVFPLANRNRDRIISLAARYKMPAIYPNREFAEEGGLVAYGASPPDAYRRPASMPDGFSRAKDLPTCRLCSQPSSS